MQLVGGPDLPILGECLDGHLEVRQRGRVQQLAQLLLAQQLAQQVSIEGQGLGTPLRHGRVAFVHVGGDVVEQERACEWRGAHRLHGVDGDFAPADSREQLAQRRQVEHVRQALAVCLHQDRERAVAAGDRQQAGRPLALLPERRPLPGTPAGQQKRPRRVLPEPRREQRRRADLGHDQVFDLVGLGKEQGLDPVEVALGQADRDPVVGPDGLHLGPEVLGQPRFERERPRRVNPRSERRQEAQPPVTQLVAEALHDHPPIGRQRTRRLSLVLQVGHQVLRRKRVEVVALAQPGQHRRPSAHTTPQVGLDLAHEFAERAPELDRPADGIAMPERQLAGLAGGRRDGHPIVADLLDPP